MRSTLGQSWSAGRWATWGLVALSLMITAKAGATTITETGTVTADTIEGLSGNNLNVNLVGQPFTLTTNFDPSTVGPLAGCTTTVCNSFGSGSTVFTAPGYNLTFPTGTTTADTVSSFYTWGPLTPGGQPVLQMNVGPFASQTVGGSVIANGYNLVASAVGSSSSPIPDPATVNGSYSTSVSSNNTLRINGASSISGQITSLAINGTSPSLYLTVGTGGSSSSGSPIGIAASLTLATQPPPPSPGTVTVLSVPLPVTVPSGDTALQQVANDLGYQGFDWQQTLSGPSPLPYYACTNPLCTATPAEAVGSSDDPAQPYGWDYCNPGNPPSSPNSNFVPNSVYGNSCVSPYYYAPSIATDSALSSDPSTGCIYKYNGACITLTDAADTTFGFFDSPSDPCLTTNGVTPAYNKTLSNGETVAQLCQNRTASGALTFDTELVGIPKNGGLPVPIAGFDWLDTFNGLGFTNTPGMGGIITPETDLTVDPQTGTGGITVTEVNGKVVSTVPEPPTVVLLLSSIVLLGLFHLFFSKNGPLQKPCMHARKSFGISVGEEEQGLPHQLSSSSQSAFCASAACLTFAMATSPQYPR
jgi:hypothetical protein